MIVFALLGMTVVGLTKSVHKSIIICYIFAILDEVHQYFILGRTAKISDTFIDALGFLSIIMAWWILMRLKDIFESF